MNHIISGVAMEKELSQLTSQALLRNLREGASRFIAASLSIDEISWARNACPRLFGR
jgi:hypothetical protein